MTNTTIKQGALNALDGMQQIVEHERLIKGAYVSAYASAPELKSLCGERRYCAIGALWIGAGERPVTKSDEVVLPGIEQREREAFLADRPALGKAYTTLNLAARNYIKRNEISDDDYPFAWNSELEAIFEASKVQVGRTELQDICRAPGPPALWKLQRSLPVLNSTQMGNHRH